jgi:hypothetical protein
MKKIIKKIHSHVDLIVLLIVVISTIIFSWWLMFFTFSYNTNTHSMIFASKVWSDFGAHIPLIRSFSMGYNWPPQYPLFPGEPIRYHFLFYFLVAMLEKAGVRIDWALNSLSIIGFNGLLIGIYVAAKKLFKNNFVAILSVIFFLFNGTLTFIKYFSATNLSLSSVWKIKDVTQFLSFAPWGAGDITAFWNLNIYTNQRHLAAAFAIVVWFIASLTEINNMKEKPQIFWAVFWGIVIGLLPFFHQPTLVIFALILIFGFLLLPKLRIFFVTCGLISLVLIIPQMTNFLSGPKSFAWYPGYLIHDGLTPIRFITYWWQNLGLHLILVPLGYILAPKNVRKYLFFIFVVFTVGFLFKFSVEIAANHKFFNLFLIFGNMLSAYVIYLLIKLIRSVKFIVLRIPLFIIPIILVIFLTLSGVIDFFAVKNDNRGPMADVEASPVASWIAKNTPPDAVFLNANFFDHPASLAGRKVFLGWPYFSWSAGYDSTNRLFKDMTAMYAPKSFKQLCLDLRHFNISYITFEDPHMPEIQFNESIYIKLFTRVYTGQNGSFRIYKRGITCL